MFMAVPENFNSSILDVSPEHWRLQAAILKADGANLLVINSYFPTDKGLVRIDEAELEVIFATIEEIIEQNQFSSLIWCGDINADFLRKSGHVRSVQQFIERLSLCSAWDRFRIDFTHFHEANNHTSVSTIDHFFWPDNLDSFVLEAGVLHSIENPSDHSPIYCVIDHYNLKQNKVEAVKSKPKPTWKKASEEQKEDYNLCISERLSNVSVPKEVSECCDVKCDNIDHRNSIDNYVEEVLHTINDTAYDCLPVPSSNKSTKKKTVAGWNTEVKPFREMSKFWGAVWNSAGRPLNNDLHQIMKKSRNLYHYQIKKCKRAQDEIKKSKLLSCFSDGGDIFDEVKKLRRSEPVVASVIDGQSDDIEGHFSSIYKTLYNSVDDQSQVIDLLNQVHENISESDLEDVKKVSTSKVKEAARHLNNNKTDPVYDFSSDCLKNAPNILYDHLSRILQAFLIHSHVSLHLLLAILVPIIKDKLGNICSSKNYRSIAISSLILKIFDWIVILLCGTTLGLDDLQFSYQAGCSASMCTWLAVETIGYFTRNGGEVFTCQADKTKAFDLVKHSILFQKLLQKNLSRIFLRLLIVMYILQHARVRWNGRLSELFSLKNGCKQGAVLSGILYNFYVNGLFQKLRELKTGCWIDLHYVGMVGYADDDWLLAPSRSALQEMLNTCEIYNKEHGLQFSTDPKPAKSKTKCLAFLQHERELKPVSLCGNKLPWVKIGKHVGQNITNEANGLKKDILVKRARFIDKNNTLRQEFDFAHPDTLLRINQTYNSDFTGSSVWDLFCREQEMLENSYSTAVRLMMGLPRETHRYFIEPLTTRNHLKSDLIKRFLTFIEQIKRSKKETLIYVLQTIYPDVRSITGSNLNHIMVMCGKNRVEDLKPSDSENFVFREIPTGEEWRINLAKELIEVHNRRLEIDSFEFDKIEKILTWVCTTGPS